MDYDESRLRELQSLIKQFGAIVEANEPRSPFRATRETIRQIQRVAEDLQLPHVPVSWMDEADDQGFMISFDAPFGDRDGHCAFLGVKADSKTGRDLKTLSSHGSRQVFNESSADAPYRFPRPAEAHRFASQTVRVWLAVIDNWLGDPETCPDKVSSIAVELDRRDSPTESEAAQFLDIEIKGYVVSRNGKAVDFRRCPRQFELLVQLIKAGRRGISIDQLVDSLYPDHGGEDALRKLQEAANKKTLSLRIMIEAKGRGIWQLKSV